MTAAIEMFRTKPFALWVIAGALVYSGLAFLVFLVEGILAFGLAAAGGILPVFLLFFGLFILAAVFTLTEKRWAYVLTAAVSTVFLLLISPYLADSLSNPADSAFWLSISLAPALLLATGFSILSFRGAKTGLLQKRHLATPHSSGGLLTIAVIGFVIGGLVAGAIGAGVILRLLEAEIADVTIVSGALSSTEPFTPRVRYVPVGYNVTWINKDTMSHTITSNVSGEFGSGLLSTGATFSQPFNAAGTYYYHCTPHPEMWGFIVVVG